MGEMSIERVRQPNLAVAQLGKVAVGKDRIDQIAEQPKIDIGPQRLDTVESQRWPVWYINMKQSDAGIDASSSERNRQLALADRI
jgi:hypothetical protein